MSPPLRRFEGRTAVVTGGSRGIGLAVARRLVDEGARVVLTARHAEALAEAAAGLGGPEVARWVAGGADDADHRAEVLALADRELGGVDVLVNNAGTNPAYGPVLAVEESVARRILDVNVLGTLGWCRDAVAAGLGARGSGQAGAVVNVASVAGLGASPGIGVYGASKAAVVSLTTQLALELAPRVRVNAVAPAVVRTRFARALYADREDEVAAGYPLGRLGEPDDVAAAVAFLASADAAWVTGQTLVVDGGASVRPLL